MSAVDTANKGLRIVPGKVASEAYYPAKERSCRDHETILTVEEHPDRAHHLTGSSLPNCQLYAMPNTLGSNITGLRNLRLIQHRDHSPWTSGNT